MFKPFFKEEKILNQGTFLDYEVQFNLFHYIVEGKELIALKTSDKDIVMKFWVGFVFDCFGINVIEEKQIPVVDSLIKCEKLYLWEVDNEICGMVNIIHQSERYARINNVYTPSEERKKGYASAMVSELCSKLINEGLIPMLYADIKNCDSNKVYKTIGFTESGRIDNIVFNYK